MAAPSLTYTLTNGQTADATQVMQNFNDLLNGITDGTKDLSISALTLAGTLTANGNVTLGNASSDTVTVTGSLASNLVPSADATYGLGSASIGYTGIYFGGNSQRVRIVPSGSTSASWTMTLPTSAGTANYILKTDGNGVTSWTPISDSNWYATNSTSGTVSTAAQSFAGLKTFYDGILLDDDAAAGGASTLSYYREYASGSLNVSGLTTTPTITLKAVRVGRCVTVTLLSGATGTSNATSFTVGSALPSGFTPAAQKFAAGITGVTDNGTEYMGYITVETSGQLTFSIAPGNSSWTSSGTKAFRACSFAYYLD